MSSLQRDSLNTFIIFLLPLLILVIIAAFNMATKPSNNNLNGETTPPRTRPFFQKPCRISNGMSFFIIIKLRPLVFFLSFCHPPANSTRRPFSPPSPQKAPRPLLPETNDGLLPRRLLSRRAGRWWQPCSRRFVSIVPCRSNYDSPSQTPRLTLSCFLGVLTKEFLDFSASRGNNLRSIGLEPGCKWCLCTARWKEAMEAAKGKDDPVVPKWVFLVLVLFLSWEIFFPLVGCRSVRASIG